MKRLKFKKQLTRAEMRQLLGGNEQQLSLDGNSASSCSASCGGGKVVTCSGPNCMATDGTGCQSDNESKKC
jgi:hypothetical protein